MGGMSLFRKKKPRVYGVMDVGSDAIKALIFERPGAAPRTNGDTAGAMVPRPIEKFVWDLPDQYTGTRLVRKIREGVLRMTQGLEKVPEQIFIAVGPTVAECALRTWRAVPDPGAGGTILTRRDIRTMYHDLFAQQTDRRRAVITVPVELQINGYPLAWQENWFSDAVLPRARVREVAFRTLSLFMPVDSGALFAEIQQALGGMPIEFIPLAAAYTEAIVAGLGVRDAFVADIGGNETALLLVRHGRLAYAAFIPYGTRRAAETLARKMKCSFRESQAVLRHYAAGLPGSSPRPSRPRQYVGAENAGAAAHIAEEPLPGAPEHDADNGKAPESPAAALEAAAERWKALFVHALDSFAAAGPLPPDLFLTGGAARFQEFRAAVQAPDWMGTVSYAAAPTLRILDGASFFGGNTLGGYLQGPEDAGLAALVVYATAHRPLF